jgi:protein TonB
LGTPYSSGSVIYLAPLGRERSHDDSKPLQIAKNTAPKQDLTSRPEPVARQREEASKTADNAPDVTASAGSPYGVHVPGTPLTGAAVMPALPQVFPDPPVARSELPPGVSGDVIVEVTIDEQGNVTDLKLTQGIGYGIDEKVLAVLRRWHFRPATRDGSSIASQHLVHFHYPA